MDVLSYRLDCVPAYEDIVSYSAQVQGSSQ